LRPALAGRSPRDLNLDAEENRVMTSEAYEAWLDGMPVDDVRGRIELQFG
jgi:hypothetical protein